MTRMTNALQGSQNSRSIVDHLAAVMRVVGYVELSLGILLTLFITAVIAASVFFRYVMSSPLIWSEEAVTISFIWVTLLGAAVAAKMNRHITITSFAIYLSGAKRIYFDSFIRLFVFGISALTAYFTLDYIGMQSRSNTVSLPINIPRGWVFAIPTLLALTSIAATEMVLLFDNFSRLGDNDTQREPVRILKLLDVADV